MTEAWSNADAMNLRVTRYELPDFRESNLALVKLRQGASIIKFAEVVDAKSPRERPTYRVFMWVIQDSLQPLEERRFWLAQDGAGLNALGENAADYYVDTWISPSGHIWQHVFDITDFPDWEPPRRFFRVRDRRFVKQEPKRALKGDP